MLLKFWGFTGLASLLASVQFPAVETYVSANPQISEARCVGYHNQIELTFAIKDTNKESIINDGGNRIATKMAVGK